MIFVVYFVMTIVFAFLAGIFGFNASLLPKDILFVYLVLNICSFLYLAKRIANLLEKEYDLKF
jgi:hypothetical protein